MTYLYFFDDIKFKNIISSKSYALLSTVNATTDVYEAGKQERELHKEIRWEQFDSFCKQAKILYGKVEDLHLKYGGICFLWDGNKTRFQKVEDHIKWISSMKHSVDILGNKDLLKRSSNLAAADKIILRKSLENSKLIWYRPTSKMIKLSQEEIINTLENDFDELTKQGLLKHIS